MREFKFRAWRMKHEQMDYSRSWVSLSEFFEYHERNYPNNFCLMQFTGLHDRNGKEIYEGDIFENHLGKYVIRFERGGFYLHNPRYISLDSEEHCDLYLSTTMDDYLGEVIGNRYENPDLLGGTADVR